jgi:hypothetical protein
VTVPSPWPKVRRQVAVGLGALVIVLIIALGTGHDRAVSGTETSSPAQAAVSTYGEPDDPQQDVRLTRCQLEPNMFATISKIQVKVTNSTDRAGSCWVTVALNSPDGATRYGEATAVTSFLGAGQTAVLNVPGLFGQLPGVVACSVAKVIRLPA